MPKTGHPILKIIEPSVDEITVHEGLSTMIALSQAISLKRIADALDAIAKGDNQHQGILQERVHG